LPERARQESAPPLALAARHQPFFRAHVQVIERIEVIGIEIPVFAPCLVRLAVAFHLLAHREHAAHRVQRLVLFDMPAG
jgi:hypothetical protein